MKAKNIVLAILMVLSFAACTSEIEGIDNNGNSAGIETATSIVVNFLTEETATKSSDNSISQYVIAVFEAKTGDRVGYASGTSKGGNPVSIENIDSKEGQVKVYVVVNAPVDKFSTIYTLNDFENATVENLDDLVMVGKNEIELKKESNHLDVALYHLSAQVKVKVNIQGDGNPTFQANAYEANIATSSKIVNPTAALAESASYDLTDVSTFTYRTYKVKNPALKLSGAISVDGKQKDVSIDISFKENGKTLDALLNGKSYELIIDLKVSVKFEVSVSYSIHEIREISNDVSFS